MRYAHSLLPWFTLLLAACPADPDPDSMDTGATATEGTSNGSATTSGETADETADETAGETTSPTGGSTADGEELYGQLCSACHGMMGEGTAIGYEVQHPVREFSTWVVRNGRPGDEFEGSVMAAYTPEVIDDGTLEQIWEFLDAAPQPTTGEGLFLDYCRNCHGPDAAGGVVSKDISDKTFDDSLERVRQGAGLADPGARMLYMPAFGPEVVSDAELQLIVDHIATL